MPCILVADDDRDIGNLLEETLVQHGYTVLRAADGHAVLRVLAAHTPDLVLLDLMMPGLSGDQLLPHLQGIPVIVVSARVDTDSKVSLLMGGAADYVTKPFSTKELLARIAVQLRKSGAVQMTFAGITLLDELHAAEIAGETVRLTRTEYAILKNLMLHPAQVVTRSALLEQISADTPDCTETSLKQHVSNLRRKLRAVSGTDCIEAVWGIGFRLHD